MKSQFKNVVQGSLPVREAVVRVHGVILLDLLRARQGTTLRIPFVSVPLPLDVKILDAQWMGTCVLLRLEHGTFPLVNPGETRPEYQIDMATVRNAQMEPPIEDMRPEEAFAIALGGLRR